jgi:hypothetical protein
MRRAIGELKEMILERYPDATFELDVGSDPEYIYLLAVVDTEHDDVMDLVGDRVLEMDVEEDLPILVMPERPAEQALRRQMFGG